MFKSIITICLLLSVCIASLNAASLREKRSPFLRLDELSNRVYIAKNKLGGGLIDPLDIGKRSGVSGDLDPETRLAATLYEGFRTCILVDKCNRALKYMIEDQ